MAIHVGQLTGYSELMNSLDLITVNAARALGVQESYGIEKGKRADLVVMDAFDELEVIRTMAPRLFVIKSGKIIARTTPAEAKIIRNGKEKDLSHYLQP
jgi:cytosine deaminase